MAENFEESKRIRFDDDIMNKIPKIEETSNFAVDGLKSIYYEALPYEGKKTKVYAYYGIPEHRQGEKVPGVVLVHGGVGYAYASWVKAWNEKGYAAIAMDMGGKHPDKQRHEWAGPVEFTYSDLSKPIEDVWMYHAVSYVILANNIMRSFDEVDSSKIGISGVSWGGVITMTAIGIDNRFAFAVPIYGCGHLYESETYFKEVLPYKNKFIDPSVYSVKSKMPVLLVNDDVDFHFSTTITTKSRDDILDHAAISFLPDTFHKQATAEAMKEPYEFANAVLGRGAALIKITKAYSDENSVTAEFDVPRGRTVSGAYLRYITDDVFQYTDCACKSIWYTVQADSIGDSSVSIRVPEEATHYYLNIADNVGTVISTGQFKK